MIFDHVGIAVEDLDQAERLYASALGGKPAHRFDLPHEAVRVAWLETGSAAIELLTPTGDGAIARFLRKRGPGLHHIAFRVDTIEVALKTLKAGGYELIDERARPGLCGRPIAFVHPRTTGGVLIELCEGGLKLPADSQKEKR